jgi:hypothetical protein
LGEGITLSPAELLIDRQQTTSFNCGVPFP